MASLIEILPFKKVWGMGIPWSKTLLMRGIDMLRATLRKVLSSKVLSFPIVLAT